jgi:lon-related putative ATP-dependent protease
MFIYLDISICSGLKVSRGEPLLPSELWLMTPTSARENRRLSADALRWVCDPKDLGFKTTSDLPTEATIVGQERGRHALQFGLGIDQRGYNIFVSGPPGTGRSTYSRGEVDRLARTRPVPWDWCYVRNFAAADQPIAISLPPGQGATFRQQVAEMVAEVRGGLKRVFISEPYEQRRADVAKRYEQQLGELMQGLEGQAKTRGLALQRTPTGIITVPVDLQGHPVSPEVFQALPDAERERLTARMKELEEAMTEAMRKARALEREGREALREFDTQTAKAVIDGPVAHLKEQYRDHPRVVAFLDAAEQDMLDHLAELRAAGDDEAGEQQRQELPFPRRDPYARYQINFLVDQGGASGAPVIIETNPTYYNLVGRAEYRAEFGALVTDFTMIKPGALHRANGGYLLLNARDVLTNPGAYEGLKRALRNGEIRIENLGEAAGLVPAASLRPDPIPLEVKVILIGTPDVYHLLYAYDEEFEKWFKIRADFDVVIDRTPESERAYARAIASICFRSGACHFDPSGVAAVLEHSARLASSQDKLSTRFNEVVEIIYEAAAWARQNQSQLVTREHVRRAVEEKAYRSNQIEERFRELIEKGVILVDTDGQVAGQINGLSVLQLGDYTFGQPSRITARAYVGSRGVVNIERETQLSGRIHSKGVFVLSSFLASRFAQRHPLSVSVSLTFEQLYSDVDGDSASSTELYAIFSELSGLPIDQGIAVTGSVNQMGEVQPIGGVNEKIEGFYYVCKAKGLTGRQGVIIPHQNIRDLMLREEVVEACRAGRFSIWGVRSVDEGIEILTGIPAGRADGDGRFPDESVNGRVARRLDDLARRFRDFSPGAGSEPPKEEPPKDAPPKAPPAPPTPPRPS